MNKKNLIMAILSVSILAGSIMLNSSPTVVYAEGNTTNNSPVPISGTNCTEENCEHEASVGAVHYDTLNEAITEANGQEIQLLKSITISAPIVITKNTVINGTNGEDVFQIDSSKANHYRQGLFHMNNEADTPATLTLKNLKLVNTSWSNPCGISIRSSNQTLNLDNVDIDTSYYCLFIGVPQGENEDVNDVVINIDNSRLIGYAAVYYRTNSFTNMIMRPVLNVNNSELTGRGVSGYGNGFATIVYNGTRNARATISNSVLSNSFDESNTDANEAIIQFNCYGAYEEGAEITLSHSVVKTKSTTSAPNLINYTAGENLNVGNKVIIDDLTFLVDENESDLIRIMRNGNELVATGKELHQVLSLNVPFNNDKPIITLSSNSSSLLTSGDTVVVPIDTTLTENAAIPENVTIHVTKGAKLSIADGVTLDGSTGAKLVVEGEIEGFDGITDEGTCIWQDNTWAVMAKEITLDKENLILQVNDTAQLHATINPEEAINKDVTWTSSDEKVIKVDATGTITAMSCGAATVTATINETDLTASCVVTVDHTYNTDWKSNETSHWLECKNCGSKADVAQHTFKWIVDKEATKTKAGFKHEECKVCGYKKANVEIPATGSTKPDNNKPDYNKPNDNKINNNKQSNTNRVKTGDQTNMGLYTSLLTISGLLVTVLAILKKRKY